MKKIFYLLLLTTTFANAQKTTGVTKLKIDQNPEKTTATRVLVQDATTKEVGYVAKTDLTIQDATTTTKGKIQLAGDLGGTADAPTVPALATKVDKENGKGLSTNDYTTADKNKLSGIEAGAEVNVNADWNATSGDAQILNKPTIPSVSGLATETYVDNVFATKENTIPSGLPWQYWRGDKTWSDFPVSNVYPLEFDTTNGTVWNNGIGDIDTNTFFGKDTYADTGGFSTAVDNVTLFGNSVFPKKTGGSRVTAIGSKISLDTQPPAYVIDGVFIGHNISPSQYSSNQILIGNDISLTNSLEDYSNSVVLGSDLITKTILRGEVRGGSFKKDGGLATQYLMADGSVSTGSFEPVISSGENSQYWRGDKTWQTLPTYTLAGLGGVPSTRTITINGVSQDLTENREWNLSPNLDPLEFNVNNRTVWNNGKGNIESNTSFGEGALGSNYDGEYNVAIGPYAINSPSSNRNTVVGYEAMADAAGTNHNDGVFMGYRARGGYYTTNQIVIGSNAYGAGSNTATLGNTLILKTILRGTINTAGLAVYADNATATAGGLVVGDIYRTSTGELKIVY